MEVDCNPKLARVLKKLLDPNFKVRNDVYLNKLLKHLTEKQSDGDGDSANNRHVLSPTYFMQWIKAVIVRCGKPKPPPPCLLPFALHMTKFMCSDEGVFVKLNGENVFERLMNTIAKAEPSASLKMAYVELLCSFLCHKSGLQWIISTNNWNEVFSLVLLAPTVYIRKSGCKFIATLIEKSVEMNEKFCFNAIQLMIAPIGVNSIGQSCHEDTLPTLQIIYLVLECLLGVMVNEENISIITKVIRMFNIERQLQQLILGNNIDLLFESSKILQITWLINFVIKHGFQKGPVTYAKIEQEVRSYWDILFLLVERGSTRQIFTFLTNSLRNWKQISSIMPICINIDQEPLFYEHQMSLLQLFPVVMVSLHLIKSNADELAKDDAIRDLFYTKCIKKGVPDTFRVAFAWRNLLLRENAFVDGTQALKYVMQSKCYYSRDVGNTAFQCLLYSLKDMTDMMKNDEVLLPLSSEVVDFTSLMLTVIVSLIKDFNLSWKDSVETVGVLEVSFNCLDIPCLPPKVSILGVDGVMPSRKDGVNAIDSTFFLAWIEELVERWCTSPYKLEDNVFAFVVNTLAFGCSHEPMFAMLNEKKLFDSVFHLIKDFEASPTLKLAYINLLSATLEHPAGLQWIVSTDIAEVLIYQLLRSPPVDVLESGCKVLAKLLFKSVELSETYCEALLRLILNPLSPDKFANPQYVNEDVLYKFLKPTLNVLIELLGQLLDQTNYPGDIKVFSIIKKLYLETLVNDILIIAKHNMNMICDLTLILHTLGVIEIFLYYGCKPVNIDYSTLEPRLQKLSDITLQVVTRISVSHVLWMYCKCWKNTYRIVGKLPICENNQVPVVLEFQILALQLYPVLRLCRYFENLSRRCLKDIRMDEIRDLFKTNLVKNLTPSIFQCAYRWEENFPTTKPFVKSSLAIRCLLETMRDFSRDVASIAFGILTYNISDIAFLLKNNVLPVTEELISHVTLEIKAIVKLVKDFNLSWKDSVETISLLEIAFNVLDISVWPAKLVVSGLSLVDVAISKYMSPNMALLIDKVHDSIMGLLGPMLYTKLHDGSWEVRDSALEVICTISHIANQKFPSYRKVILDSDFPSVVIKMATQDGEPFVRATAWKCLREMIQVKEFWCKLCENEHISEQLLRVLHTETEGIVRKEAAAAMSTIYEYHDIAEDVLGKLYDIMTHCVLVDLHWEVKVNALNFWSKVIDRHLTNQGMIDGTFPTVTFSKEHRKIVMLTEAEVRKRLVKVLNQLSETGCLAVFAAALQDDCDSEVSRASLELIRNFVEMLKKYNVTENIVTVSTPPSPLEAFGSSPYQPLRSTSTPTTPSTGMSDDVMNYTEIPSTVMDSDTVLEGLLDIQDIKLLEAVFNSSNQPTDDYVQIKGKQVMKPADFLKFVYSDLEASLSDKRRWLKDIDDFDSLLDDILREYNAGDVNSMDCY